MRRWRRPTAPVFARSTPNCIAARGALAGEALIPSRPGGQAGRPRTVAPSRELSWPRRSWAFPPPAPRSSASTSTSPCVASSAFERRSQVPSEATFSRAFAEFARGELPDKIHAALIERALGGHIIGAIARDATEIEAREKPVQNKANDGKDDPPASDPPPPRKRGRPPKDEQRPKPEPTRLERQVTQNLGQMLADLPTACDLGCKKNSKGYKETWTGYKLHIDVACGQIPVSCVLTSVPGSRARGSPFP